MAHVFRGWFMWGFWGSIAQLIILTIFVPIFILCKETFQAQQIIFIVL